MNNRDHAGKANDGAKCYCYKFLALWEFTNGSVLALGRARSYNG